MNGACAVDVGALHLNDSTGMMSKSSLTGYVVRTNNVSTVNLSRMPASSGLYYSGRWRFLSRQLACNPLIYRNIPVVLRPTLFFSIHLLPVLLPWLKLANADHHQTLPACDQQEPDAIAGRRCIVDYLENSTINL